MPPSPSLETTRYGPIAVSIIGGPYALSSQADAPEQARHPGIRREPGDERSEALQKDEEPFALHVGLLERGECRVPVAQAGEHQRAVIPDRHPFRSSRVE